MFAQKFRAVKLSGAFESNVRNNPDITPVDAARLILLFRNTSTAGHGANGARSTRLLLMRLLMRSTEVRTISRNHSVFKISTSKPCRFLRLPGCWEISETWQIRSLKHTAICQYLTLYCIPARQTRPGFTGISARRGNKHAVFQRMDDGVYFLQERSEARAASPRA